MISNLAAVPPAASRSQLPAEPRDTSINAILLVYHHPISQNAPTILEHIHEFKRHSKFAIVLVNTEFGFPPQLRGLRFRTIVLHYSLFGSKNYALPDAFRQYLVESDSSHKIAFFQDEYNCCTQRFQFINRYKIDTIYTLVDPRYFGEVYEKYTSAKKLIYNLPSYVSNDLPYLATKHSKPDAQRRIDVGYRGRISWHYMGKGAAEKWEIAGIFRKRAEGLGLKLDLEVAENKRIYGERWYRFLGDCKAVIGVEAGVSIFDLEDQARLACEDYLREKPYATFDELSREVLYQWENNVPYRTIGPRHFEAAALRCCQILYEGDYSGVLKPMVHYIPLKKDFSNFDHVISMYRDASLRKELTENSYRDLIASGKYTYRQCVEDFDRELVESGMEPEIDAQRRRAAGNSGKRPAPPGHWARCKDRRASGSASQSLAGSQPGRRCQAMPATVEARDSRHAANCDRALLFARLYRGFVPWRWDRGFQRGRQ